MRGVSWRTGRSNLLPRLQNRPGRAGVVSVTVIALAFGGSSPAVAQSGVASETPLAAAMTITAPIVLPDTYIEIRSLDCGYDAATNTFKTSVSLKRIGQNDPNYDTNEVGVILSLRYLGASVSTRQAGVVRADGSTTIPAENAQIELGETRLFRPEADLGQVPEAGLVPIVPGRTYELRLVVIDFNGIDGAAHSMEFPCTASPVLEACQTAPESDPVLCYAPRVYLHSEDDYRPMSPSEYIGESALKFAHDDGCDDDVVVTEGLIDPVLLGSGAYSARQQLPNDYDCEPYWDPVPSNAISYPFQNRLPVWSSFPAPAGFVDNLRKNEGFYLKPNENARAGVSPAVRPVDVVVEHKPGDYVAYWFFYPFNKPRCAIGESPAIIQIDCPVFAQHEGDWEQVVVKLGSGGKASEVTVFDHGNPSTKPYEAVEKVPGAPSNPVVYSARGSHATYFDAGERFGLSAVGVDVRDTGVSWDTWLSLRLLEDEPWANSGDGSPGFRGAWGGKLTGHPASDPPTGPPCKSGLTGRSCGK